MINKIIAVVLASLLSFAVLLQVAVPVYAEDTEITERYFVEKYLSYTRSFLNGDCSYAEYQDAINKLDEAYKNNFSSELSDSIYDFCDAVSDTAQGIGDFFSNIGDEFNYFYGGLIDDFFADYKALEAIENVNLDMQGATAVLYRYDSQSDMEYWYYSSEAGVLRNKTDTGFGVKISYDYYIRLYNDEYTTYEKSSNYLSTYYYSNPEKFAFYGTWIWEDTGETDTENTTPATTTEEELNFDGLSDDELLEMFMDLLDLLKTLSPDLSSIEGILEAIYYQVSGINSNMLTYNDCNALISALIATENENAAQIVLALQDLKESLKNGTDEDTGTTDTTEETKIISGTVYNVKPLDMNWLDLLVNDPTQLKVEYLGKKYYLESDGTLEIDGKYYYVDMNYDSYLNIDFDLSNDDISADQYSIVGYDSFSSLWNSLSNGQKKKIDNIYSSVISLVGNAIPYSIVCNIIRMVEIIVFNVNEPTDITLTFEQTTIFGQTIDGFSVTILSTEFFNDEKVIYACSIIKGFTTCLIIYAWLLTMRRKVINMI